MRAEGGVIRLVAPKDGFNSHEWNQRRPSMGWHRNACFQDGWFVVRTNLLRVEP